MRRTTVLTAAAAALALAALSACNDDGTAAAGPPSSVSSASAVPTTVPPATAPATASATDASTAPGSFDPEKAVATKRAPYSAAMNTTTVVADIPGATVKGRVNLVGPFTGRIELRTADAAPVQERVHTESVILEDVSYIRDLTKPGSPWEKVPRTDAGQQADYASYADLLLKAGPSARKGMEQVAGTPAYHLSGRVTLEQLAVIDPRTYRSMKGKADSFVCDQWIDSQGRTLRFEQRTTIQGMKALNTITFTDFEGPVTVTAPTDS
ncbi:hypothetical protein ACWEQL_28465 [Kitasatospora sp. NPDC004240]